MKQTSIGIDPGGSSGCVCIMHHNEDGSRRLVFLRFSKLTEQEIMRELQKEVSWARLKRHDVKCTLEKVNAMPGQGVSSTFKFGQNFGWIRGVLMALRIVFFEERPAQWMKQVKMNKNTGEEKSDHKKRRRQVIQNIYPDVKLTNDTFDALWLAEFTRQYKFK